MKDAFLSEEDLDLRHLSFVELNRAWNAWLRQAQVTNQRDLHEYSHGVFSREPSMEYGVWSGERGAEKRLRNQKTKSRSVPESHGWQMMEKDLFCAA